ncbi:kinase/pyrophosphorylase [Arachnia propionica]|uniref:Putative pyruvate, phosphate dikinase regulatory protein n=1 Tax=Arachnia propionica TaxID=1750 RepID=A0A3P1T9X9_9ACTN|nr:pyruvate, water dikinase regulatory protein [Arachnia propionica]MDO5083656.1 pyruvate, water dikinase regulatory protein [Arachnia propionica]RRD06241.1 kinase/pyrophosphorylase [Arachnia propionica]
MTKGDLEIHVLADSTGETAVRLARAARAQFPDAPFEIIRHPRLGRMDAMVKALNTLKERSDRPIAVFFTLVNAELRSLVINACTDLGLPYTDLMGDALAALEKISGHTADEVPMRPVGVEADYFVRISAMEFAIRNDDGAMPAALRECDICLIGASRSGKTPLSIYLGYLGYKTVNVPLVPGIEPPEELFGIDRWRIVGLTIDAERLLQIRSRRVQGLGGFGTRDGYADLVQIYDELDEVGKIQRRLGAPIIDTTGLALEEAAARIIDIVDERARKAGSQLRRPAGQLRITP